MTAVNPLVSTDTHCRLTQKGEKHTANTNQAHVPTMNVGRIQSWRAS